MHTLAKPRIAGRAMMAMLLASAALLPAAAFAQTTAPAAAEPATVEPAAELQTGDIVVTANRRSESLQKVGLSVAAQSGQKLEALNIKRPEDVVRLVPGLTAIPNSGSAASSFAIRGVGQSDFSEHQEQPVSVYQDGVYISLSSATGFPLFDIQRVEVLRGPQGTLFGRNATGGLIQFQSNQPKAGFSGALTLTTGDRNLRRAEGFINGGDDRLSFRVAGFYSDRKGYIKNTAGANLLDEEIGAIRAQVLFTPDDATTVKLRVEGFNSNGTSSAGKALPASSVNGVVTPVGPNDNPYGTGPGNDIFGKRDVADPFTLTVDDPGLIRKRSRTAALTFTHDFGNVTLSSISAYTYSSVTYREDSDASPLPIQAYGDGGASDTFSQELRFEGQGDNYRWTAGGFFLNIDGRYSIDLAFPHLCDTRTTTSCAFVNNGTAIFDFVNGGGATWRSDYKLRTRSTALFGQGEYDFTDKLTATLGGRVTFDNQRFVYQFNCAETLGGACNAIGGSPAGLLGLGPVTLNQNYTNFSGKVGLNYKASSALLLYGFVSRGVKSGSYFADVVGATPISKLAIRPEKLTDYEVGFKSTFFDRKLTINGAAFIYDYKDFQTFAFNGVNTSVVNLPAYAKGGELEIRTDPGHGFSANLGIAYNDFWVKNVVGGTIRQRPINAPQWQINWGLSKTFDLPDETSLTFGYNGRYTSSRYFNIFNSPITQGAPFTLHDVTISATHGNLSVNAFVTNVTNKTYTLINFDQSFEGFYLQHIAEPRTFGISGTVKF